MALDPRKERIYYQDPYQFTFEALVTSSMPQAGRYVVRLDRTAFYPASGGQPSDRGTLGGHPVLAVDQDAEGVFHLTHAPLAVGERVVGEVDGALRLEHMRHHTAQHLLSAAFLQRGWQTQGFHLGPEVAHVDLRGGPLDLDAAREVELVANRVVWENRPVSDRWLEPEAAAALGLRRPPAVTGPVRVVEIEGWDLCPCGGTHVRATGEIGSIRICALDRAHQGARVTFVAGERALRDAWRRFDALARAARQLSVEPLEVPEALIRAREREREREQVSEARLSRLVELEAQAMRQVARNPDDIRGIFKDRDPLEVERLARRLGELGSFCLLVAENPGAPGRVYAARGEGEGADLGEALRGALAASGGKGGGSVRWAQGVLGALADAKAFLNEFRP